MAIQPDHCVRELGSTRLKPRGDILVTPQASVLKPYYLIEDPLNSRFFRVGPAEYTFISLLDGTDVIARTALSHLSNVMPNHRMSEHDAAGLCRWLVEMDLAQTEESSQSARLAQLTDGTGPKGGGELESTGHSPSDRSPRSTLRAFGDLVWLAPLAAGHCRLVRDCLVRGLQSLF